MNDLNFFYFQDADHLSKEGPRMALGSKPAPVITNAGKQLPMVTSEPIISSQNATPTSQQLIRQSQQSKPVEKATPKETTFSSESDEKNGSPAGNGAAASA